MQDPDNTPGSTASTIQAWRKWLILFIPLTAANAVALHWFGFRAVMPWIIGLLVLTLAYQRYVKKRTWASILWGHRAAVK